MRALIVVDVQNDFLPGGALAVPGGDTVIAPINRLIATASQLLPVATQDWHPRGHGSFAANHDGCDVGDVVDLNGSRQVLWPVHCVAGTDGAEFAPGLDADSFAAVVRKGMDPTVDSYSGFADNARGRKTGLAGLLRERGVTEVFVAGLATDYCVKFTALDALAAGFRTILVEDACRGVELQTGDVRRALEEIEAAGGEISPVDRILYQR